MHCNLKFYVTVSIVLFIHYYVFMVTVHKLGACLPTHIPKIRSQKVRRRSSKDLEKTKQTIILFVIAHFGGPAIASPAVHVKKKESAEAIFGMKTKTYFKKAHHQNLLDMSLCRHRQHLNQSFEHKI